MIYVFIRGICVICVLKNRLTRALFCDLHLFLQPVSPEVYLPA